MQLIKKQSKETYKSKTGKECHYYNYYIVFDNGVSIQIKPSFSDKKDEWLKLDLLSTYEK